MPDSPRWCARCEQYGDHHTDRCPKFAQAATDACPRYRRSLDGKVIHTLDCTRTRRAGVEWTYAEGMPLEWLIEQLPKYPWLRLCKFCFTQPEAGR